MTGGGFRGDLPRSDEAARVEADLCKRTDAMGTEIRDARLALIIEGRIAEMCMGVKNFT